MPGQICTDSSFISFYWGSRTDKIDACASRVQRFLNELSSINRHLRGWKTIQKMASFNWREIGAVKEVLIEGADEDGIEDDKIPTLGFRIGLLSKSPSEEPFNLSIQTGSTVTGVSNLCMLVCSTSSPAYAEFASRSTILRVCEIIVQYWDPDYGLVTSSELDESLFPNNPYEVGWITYRAPRNNAPVLPGSFEHHEIPDRGTLILATEEPFCSDRPDHIDALKNLGKLLGVKVAKGRPNSNRGHSGRSDLEDDRGDEKDPLDHRQIVLNLQLKPTAQNASRFAEQMVKAARTISKVKLDYLPASLRKVDRIIEDFRDDGVATEQIAETLFSLGCYVGEVFVRNAGGKWVADRTSAFGLAIRIGKDTICYPIERAFKRHELGSRESVAYFYECFVKPE